MISNEQKTTHLETEKPLVDKTYLLEKYPGKGGWTYVLIPEVLPNKNLPFGWVRVKGFIDDFEIKNYNLMPLGKGRLFLPVKAEIRKKIRKQEGDWVKVLLYADNSRKEVPEEFLDYLKEDPIAYNTFFSFTDGQQKEYIEWIYSAKTDNTKIKRIAESLNKLVKGEKLKDNK